MKEFIFERIYTHLKEEMSSGRAFDIAKDICDIIETEEGKDFMRRELREIGQALLQTAEEI